MAKKKLTWKRTNSLLSCGRTIGDAYAAFARFDIVKLFKGYMALNVVQKTIVEYGLKQKLADACARPADMKLTDSEMADQMNETFNLLVAGEWNKKPKHMTALDRKLTERANLQEMIKKAVTEAGKQGMKPKQAKEFVNKLFGPQLAILNTTIAALQKVEDKK